MKLYWYKKLVVSSEFDDSDKKLLKKINSGKTISGIYLIVVSGREDAMFEIVPSQHIFSGCYSDGDIFIVGAAGSNEQATDAAAAIVLTVLTKAEGTDYLSVFTEECLDSPTDCEYIYSTAGREE